MLLIQIRIKRIRFLFHLLRLLNCAIFVMNTNIKNCAIWCILFWLLLPFKIFTRHSCVMPYVQCSKVLFWFFVFLNTSLLDCVTLMILLNKYMSPMFFAVVNKIYFFLGNFHVKKFYYSKIKIYSTLSEKLVYTHHFIPHVLTNNFCTPKKHFNHEFFLKSKKRKIQFIPYMQVYLLY